MHPTLLVTGHPLPAFHSAAKASGGRASQTPAGPDRVKFATTVVFVSFDSVCEGGIVTPLENACRYQDKARSYVLNRVDPESMG